MNIPYDKKLHFIAGVVVCIIVALIFKNPLYGLIAAAVAGIAKEIWDYRSYGKPDFMDCLATWIGGIAGYIVAFLVHGL